MNKKISFDSLLQVIAFLPLFSTAPDYSTAKNSAAKPLLEQLINRTLGVVFCSPSVVFHLIILHLFGLSIHLDKIEQKNKLDSLAWVGSAV